jgi:hypothetical protein
LQRGKINTHRPSVNLAIGMWLQLIFTSIVVEGTTKRRRLTHPRLEWRIGKSNKYRLRHLAPQVVDEIVCCFSHKQGNALSRHGWWSAQNVESFRLDRARDREVRLNGKVRIANLPSSHPLPSSPCYQSRKSHPSADLEL